MEKIRLKPHNKTAVDKIVEAYRKGMNRVIYTSGVGTGKSFVFMGVAEKLMNEMTKILYVFPRYTVKENLEEYADLQWLSENITIDFITYNYFTDREKGIEKIKNYDLVVIDEAHHLFSDKYGDTLAACMKAVKGTKFLGLTATPERDIKEDGRKVSANVKELFEISVNGLSNFDAIRLGLMPPFIYRVMLPEKDPKQVEKEYGNEVNVKVEYEDCETTLSEIVNTYQRKKWIVYFSDKKKLHEKENLVRRVFDGYEIFILYSDLRNLNAVIHGVQNAEKAVVLSVDMLLEGVHLPDVTGIVLFRNVTSLVTFQQILGRVCSIGNKTSPVIADASSSGPAMLAKLYKMSMEATARPVTILNGNTKPIFTLGIGADKEWTGIEEFLRLYSPEWKDIDVKKKLDEAEKKYLSLDGKIFDSIEEWKKSRLDYQKATACAKCFSVSPILFIKSLQKRVSA